MFYTVLGMGSFFCMLRGPDELSHILSPGYRTLLWMLWKSFGVLSLLKADVMWYSGSARCPVVFVL